MRERTRSDGETKMVNIGNEWDNLLADQFRSEYYRKLRAFLSMNITDTMYIPCGLHFQRTEIHALLKVKAVL